MAFAVAPAVLLASCLTVEGQSSDDMKREFQNSYLYKSVKRFYPDGVPADPAVVYPDLRGRRLTPFKDEMADLIDGIRKTHEERREQVARVLKPLPSPTVWAGVTVENSGRPHAYSSSDGRIMIDVRVLQAIFRGTLLASSERSSRAAAVDPEVETQQQRKAIQEFVDLVHQVDGMKSHTMFGDMASSFGNDRFDDPWFKLVDVSRTTQNLQVTYVGATLFLLAHEYGHLALGHHAQNARLDLDYAPGQRRDDSAYCERKRQFEMEADAYALILLTPYFADKKAPSFLVEMMGLSSISGYDNFFRYGYRLSGFQDDGLCHYPSNAQRRDALAAMEKKLSDNVDADFAKVFPLFAPASDNKERTK